MEPRSKSRPVRMCDRTRYEWVLMHRLSDSFRHGDYEHRSAERENDAHFDWELDFAPDYISPHDTT